MFDVDVNWKLNIQGSEIPRLICVNRESSQPIDKIEPRYTAIIESYNIFILSKTISSLCGLSDSWKFLWSEIEKFF